MYFAGNSNLVYTIIRKRNVFHQLANLPTEHSAIAKALTKRGKKFSQLSAPESKESLMEGSFPAAEAEPGTLKTTLAATPGMFSSYNLKLSLSLKYHYYTMCTLQDMNLNQEPKCDGRTRVTLYVTSTFVTGHKNLFEQRLHTKEDYEWIFDLYFQALIR